MSEEEAVKSAYSTETKDTSTKSFPFFKLPAELRNLVYKSLAQPQTSCITDSGVTVASTLLEASVQLYEEYVAILLEETRGFEARVTGFDFEDVMVFLDTMNNTTNITSDDCAAQEPRCLKMHITLEVTPETNESESLNRWLTYHLLIMEGRTGIDITYQRTKSTKREPTGSPSLSQSLWMETKHRVSPPFFRSRNWSTRLFVFMIMHLDNAAGREANKMWAALRNI